MNAKNGKYKNVVGLCKKPQEQEIIVKLTKSFLIPFDLDGNMIWCGNNIYSWQKIDWRENCSFAARLRITGYHNTRASSVLEFEAVVDEFNDKPTKYYMFVADFVKIADKLRHGELYAEFTFAKKGSSYGIKYLCEQ